jgi:hypothetical protein
MYFNGTDWIRLAKGSADEVLTMNNGATAPEWEVAGSGAVTREGGNTVEAETVSTSDFDLLTASSLDIGATSPLTILVNTRKTVSSNNGGTKIGIKLTTSASTVEVLTPQTIESGWNQESNHLVDFSIGSRVAGYLSSGGFRVLGVRASSPPNSSSGNHSGFTGTDMPTTTITAIVITANVTTSGITQAADEMHVYSMATS